VPYSSRALHSQNVGDHNINTQHFHYYTCRWFITLMVLVVVVCLLVMALLLSPGGAFKLFESTTPTTPSSPSTTLHTPISSTASLPPLVCTSGCLDAIKAVLLSVEPGTSSYLTLNFQVTDTGSDSCQMYFSPLILWPENRQTEYNQPQGPGTIRFPITLMSNESVTISPYFPQAPLQGRFDVQVGIHITCGGITFDNILYQLEPIAL
jgi:hypothetical protein